MTWRPCSPNCRKNLASLSRKQCCPPIQQFPAVRPPKHSKILPIFRNTFNAATGEDPSKTSNQKLNDTAKLLAPKAAAPAIAAKTAKDKTASAKAAAGKPADHHAALHTTQRRNTDFKLVLTHIFSLILLQPLRPRIPKRTNPSSRTACGPGRS